MAIGVLLLLPLVPRVDPATGWWLAPPLAIAGAGLGLLVSQLNNYTLAPIEEERISEAAGVNWPRLLGLSFGLALAGSLMLASLAFNFANAVEDSAVLPPDDKEQVTAALEEDAELMSNTQLDLCWPRSPKRSRTRSSASTPRCGRGRCRSRWWSRCWQP